MWCNHQVKINTILFYRYHLHLELLLPLTPCMHVSAHVFLYFTFLIYFSR